MVQPSYNKIPTAPPEPIQPESPTKSDMLDGSTFELYDAQLRVLSKPFKIHWSKLEAHYCAPENKLRKENYHVTFPKDQRKIIFNGWKDYMKTTNSETYYLDYIESHHTSQKIKTLTQEKWEKEDNTKVISTHPPVETIVINHKNAKVIASPYKIPESKDANKMVIEQNNYTNTRLIVIGKQLDKIESKVDKLIPQEITLKLKKEKPLVKFQELKPESSLKVNPTMRKIEEMFKELTPVKPKPNKDKDKGKEEETSVSVLQFEVNSGSESAMSLESVSSQESETSNMSKIEQAFSNLQVNQDSQSHKVSRLTGKVNPTSLTKNWYPKPTPPDVQFEERTQSQFSVSSDKLYEWNIDGLSEQEILNKLQHMSMAANSYATNHQLK